MPAKQKRVRFISFVMELDRKDSDVKIFQQFCTRHKHADVLLSSNPLIHATYFAHHFRKREQLFGYFKCMIEYFDDERNMLPVKIAGKQKEFLSALQRVADWFCHEQQQPPIFIAKKNPD